MNLCCTGERFCSFCWLEVDMIPLNSNAANISGGGGVMMPFACVLHDILENSSSTIIAWNISGTNFKINDFNQFSSTILPQYYASFGGKLLCMYDRVCNPFNILNSSYEWWCFHRCFRKLWV